LFFGGQKLFFEEQNIARCWPASASVRVVAGADFIFVTNNFYSRSWCCGRCSRVVIHGFIFPCRRLPFQVFAVVVAAAIIGFTPSYLPLLFAGPGRLPSLSQSRPPFLPSLFSPTVLRISTIGASSWMDVGNFCECHLGAGFFYFGY